MLWDHWWHPWLMGDSYRISPTKLGHFEWVMVKPVTWPFFSSDSAFGIRSFFKPPKVQWKCLLSGTGSTPSIPTACVFHYTTFDQGRGTSFAVLPQVLRILAAHGWMVVNGRPSYVPPINPTSLLEKNTNDLRRELEFLVVYCGLWRAGSLIGRHWS